MMHYNGGKGGFWNKMRRAGGVGWGSSVPVLLNKEVPALHCLCMRRIDGMM